MSTSPLELTYAIHHLNGTNVLKGELVQFKSKTVTLAVHPGTTRATELTFTLYARTTKLGTVPAGQSMAPMSKPSARMWVLREPELKVLRKLYWKWKKGELKL